MAEDKEKESKWPTIMEWLFTYGWAILIVAIMILALWYFGVLSPD